MNELKILNSPHARILTQCEHCDHVMKTTADSLYYLVGCPKCFRDFIVHRYKSPAPIVSQPVEKKVEKKALEVRDENEKFIRAVYDLSWPVYNTGLIFILCFTVFELGFSENYQFLLGAPVAFILLTVVHYTVLCLGSLYFKKNNHF